MNNALYELLRPIINLICECIIDLDEDVTADDLQEQFLFHIESSSCPTDKEGVAADEIESAIYALVALIDEVILQSDWRAREQWVKQPLQLKVYKHRLAGDEFYRRLSVLQYNVHSNIDVLEIYYLCVCLGFKGKLQNSLQELATIKAGLKLQIESIRKQVDNRLAPQAKASQLSFSKSNSNIYRSRYFQIAIIFVVFIGCWYAYERMQEQRVVNKLKQIYALAANNSVVASSIVPTES